MTVAYMLDHYYTVGKITEHCFGRTVDGHENGKSALGSQ